MTGLLVALVGGLVWVGFHGSADLATFLVGAVVSTAAAWATRIAWRGGLPLARLPRAVALCGQILFWFTVDLVVANAWQLRLVLSPRLRVRPQWVHFTTRLEHPATREILGVLISLTPGTVTEEMRGEEVVIHVLDETPGEDHVAAIRSRYEAPLAQLEAL
ncbi:MAG: Na+/H+ antiporter subunit E [Acidobacteriota bacterium]